MNPAGQPGQPGLASRHALADGSRRVNHIQHKHTQSEKAPHIEPGSNRYASTDHLPLRSSLPVSPPLKQYSPNPQARSRRAELAMGQGTTDPRLSVVSKEINGNNSNRNSQISTTSTNASDGKRIKTHIGPWNLGKTLGKGSTARVRLARHCVTGQEVAIKVIPKATATLVQTGSLASLSKREAKLPNSNDGFRRMPYGIEREVAIMKLIEHPHIMKLFDIWENRTEIYLVLEYVDQGELFEYISSRGRLCEEEAVRVFRQILSAIGYCHSFNICHRDLKPENILICRKGDIKIADFGMAALHQGPNYHLKTSCGSPHYAAPEVIRSGSYKGDKADIWGMGIILYASLCGRLPFDHADLGKLLQAVQKGEYQIPDDLSDEAYDLLVKIIQVNPRDRLTVQHIWQHPLIKKYDYLDDLGGGKYSSVPDYRRCGRPVLRRSDINREILRHLKSMWHSLDEAQVIKLLLSEEPNEQKLFYILLNRHREAQLENYIPDIDHSKSDYHHAKPVAIAQKHSTSQFTQSKGNGHGRQVSRFTVVSNVGKGRHGRKDSEYTPTEASATVHSYDPFKASRTPLPDHAQVHYANVVVHHGRASLQEARSPRSSVPPVEAVAAGRMKEESLLPPRSLASRSSIASSSRSRGSGSTRRARLVPKRGVSFTHLHSGSAQRFNRYNPAIGRHSRFSEVTDDGGDTLRAVCSPPMSSQYGQPRRATGQESSSQVKGQHDRFSGVWRDDVRKHSSSLAKVCDEAFNRRSVVSTAQSEATVLDETYARTVDTPMSSLDPRGATASPHLPQHVQLPANRDQREASFNSRPLPPPPPRTESVKKDLAEARKRAQEYEDRSPGHVERIVTHLDKLLAPSPLRYKGKNRVASAPAAPAGPAPRDSPVAKALDPIDESNSDDTVTQTLSEYERFIAKERAKAGAQSRYSSAPQTNGRGKQYDLDDRVSRRDARLTGGLRIVDPSSPSPAKPPAPLKIRKKSSRGPENSSPPMMTGGLHILSLGVRDNSPAYVEDDIFVKPAPPKPRFSKTTNADDTIQHGDPHKYEETGSMELKKKTKWFNRTYATKLDVDESLPSQSSSHNNSNIGTVRLEHVRQQIPSPKKKGFNLGNIFKKRGSRQGNEMGMPSFNIYDDGGHSVISEDDYEQNAKLRQIEPRQNWLARLFKVKPATKHLCFSVGKSRARREIVSLLREWRKYGVRDIVIDKERNIVFGRIASKNYLNMKEVAFACEIMTVIEHGRKFPLSIARLTQEKGAASSFHKVVDTLETVLKSRGMLVNDSMRRKMMVKTLIAA